MARWILVAENDCADPEREAEFNEWYDKVHVPDALEALGFRSATRYEKIAVRREPTGGKPKFLAIYEIEADDINLVMKDLARVLDQKKAQGRYSPLTVIVSVCAYKPISFQTK